MALQMKRFRGMTDGVRSQEAMEGKHKMRSEEGWENMENEMKERPNVCRKATDMGIEI